MPIRPEDYSLPREFQPSSGPPPWYEQIWAAVAHEPTDEIDGYWKPNLDHMAALILLCWLAGVLARRQPANRSIYTAAAVTVIFVALYNKWDWDILPHPPLQHGWANAVAAGLILIGAFATGRWLVRRHS